MQTFELNSLQIELRSIIKLKDILTRNGRLYPDIKDNDKTPSWDGDIYIHKTSSLRKDDILGYTKVQVKGHKVNFILNKNFIKYPIDTTDLNNYLASNGVVYFVVHITENDEFKIFYNALLPYDILKELKEKKVKNP